VSERAAAALRIPAHRVSRRAVALWTVRAGLGWLAVVLAAAGAALGVPNPPSGWPVALAALVVLAAAHTAVMPSWRYRVHRWEATADAVYTQAGWLSQEWRVAPMSRIQTVDTQRGPLQQLFGLATVTVTTASAAGPLHIEGLDARLAGRLVERLTATTQAAPGDAT
jgi:membrane protein YdbS with pleckstrin-like domain